MSKTLEFYFDFGSPTAYLAHKRLCQLSEQYDLEVRYVPMLAGRRLQGDRQYLARLPFPPRASTCWNRTCPGLPGAMACRSTSTRTSPSTPST